MRYWHKLLAVVAATAMVTAVGVMVMWAETSKPKQKGTGNVVIDAVVSHCHVPASTVESDPDPVPDNWIAGPSGDYVHGFYIGPVGSSRKWGNVEFYDNGDVYGVDCP